MFTLIALGTGAAYLYSLVATFAPGVFPSRFRMMDGAVGVYYEAAAVITVLVLLGQVLELRARDQTGGAIRALLNLAPKTARRLRDGADDEEIGIDQVQVGDRLRVRPGDGVPVDGEVLDGNGAVDESMVTGESMPSPKVPGDKVIGGTVNGTGSLVVRADVVGSGGMLARIVAMVAEAQRSRAPIQRMADTVAGYFVPGRACGRGCRLCCLGDLGTGSRACVRADRRRVGRHHRLPVRARAGHADVDHGRRRQGRRNGRAHQVRRLPGAHGEGRYARRRQDRHPHRGQAQGDQRPCRR